MSSQEIDAKKLSEMFLAGAKYLENKKEIINELNVFPVPDGDTGTNMTMTIMSAAKEVLALGNDFDMAAICKAMSSGSLRGARGNSGVILSQLLRGFGKRVKEEEIITIPVIAEAFEKAVETAYKAVMKPKEGTILTVAKGAADKAKSLYESGETDMGNFLNEILEHSKYVLSQTPEMLPVLKEAGVVDSGGAGLVEVFSGALDVFLGKEIDLTINENEDKTADAAEEYKAPTLEFLYCTEFDINLKAPINKKQQLDLKGHLEAIGEEVVCVEEGSKILVHIHTNDPGFAIQKGLKYGELTDVKIINMLKEELKERISNEDKEATASAQAKSSEPRKPYGFVAVSVGDGINEIFKSLGVDVIIEGGQTMNPSTEDILNAVDKVNADTVFVLPNNKNIILAANQAAELTTDKALLVIPTKNIPQGITAVINFLAEATPDENETNMIREIGNVKTGQVTYAVRDTVIDEMEIKKDDYMGIGDKGIASVGKDIDTVIDELVESMVDDGSELISIYYGSDVSESDAEALRDKLSVKYDSCDIELQNGGQPIYYYVISVE